MEQQKAWYALPEDEVVATLSTDRESGLDEAEVRRRQEQFGKNELPEKKKTPGISVMSQTIMRTNFNYLN